MNTDLKQMHCPTPSVCVVECQYVSVTLHHCILKPVISNGLRHAAMGAKRGRSAMLGQVKDKFTRQKVASCTATDGQSFY